MVALPECFLGLVPGWGGAYLLPRLIGPAAALKLIIENPLAQNKMLRGPEAFGLGIADAMFEPADFLEESLRWAARVLTGAVSVPTRELAPAGEWDAAVAAARFLVDGKLHGAAPAPYRALDLVAAARTATRDEAFAAEDDALADLMLSDELRAGLYAFDLVQKRAKRPAGAPDKSLARPVTKVGVVGAGLMAAQIALLFVRRLQVPVVMTDLDQARVDSGVAYVHAEIDKQLSRGRLSARRRQPAEGADHRLGVQGRVRRRRLRDRGGLRGAGGQAAGVRRGRGGRLAGRACSRPTPRRCRSPRWRPGWRTRSGSSGSTSSTRSRCCRSSRWSGASRPTTPRWRPRSPSARQLKKNCVIVADRPAFVVNRLLTRFLGEITRHGRRGHPVRGRRARRRPARPADDPVPAAAAGRAADRAARGGDPARRRSPTGSPSPPKLRALAESGKSSVYRPDFSVDPEVDRAARPAATARPPAPRCSRGPWRGWPRRSGSCSTRAWSPRPRTSTCA